MEQDISRINEMTEMYKAGQTLAAIGQAVGLHQDNVRYHLRRAGVQMRSVGRRRMGGQRVLLTLSDSAVARLDELASNGVSRSAAVEGLLSRSCVE